MTRWFISILGLGLLALAGCKTTGDQRRPSAGEPTPPPQVGTPPDLSAVRPVGVAAGSGHTCVLHQGGHLTCFGDNRNAQLGVRQVARSSPPVHRPRLPHRAVQVEAGGDFTCAATDAGQVHCWGWIFSDPKTGRPRRVPGLGGVTSLAAGRTMVCATRRQRDAVCWGRVPWARGRKPYDLVPLGVDAVVTSVVANQRFVCVTLADGTARCRGEIHGRKAPAGTWQVISGVARGKLRRAVGTARHVCFETASEPLCFGADDYGQLSGLWGGDGKRTPPFARSARRLAAAGSRTCAISAAGRVACWGHGYNGEQGVDPAAPLVGGVVPVVGVAGAVDISAGQHHTCAVQRDGAVFCWGSNEHGQLGDGVPVHRADPSSLGRFDQLRLIRGGWHDTCALDGAGKVTCWGGRGPGPWPQQARFYGTVRTFDRGQVIACALLARGGISCGYFNKTWRCKDSDRRRHCAFASSWRSVPRPDPPSKVIDLAVDRIGNICVLTEKGRALCLFHLGESGGAFGGKWFAIPGIKGATAIESTADGMCVVHGARQRVSCWRDHRFDGDEDFAQLPPRPTPAAVIGLASVTQLAGGGSTFCAVTRNKKLRCWRPAAVKSHSPLLRPLKPHPMAGVPRAEHVSGSDAMFCSLYAGKVSCWGRGKWQPGLPYARRARAARPQLIALPGAARLLGVGYGHVCAQTVDRHLWCWGLDDKGQLGLGRVASSYRPVRVKLLTTKQP